MVTTRCRPPTKGLGDPEPTTDGSWPFNANIISLVAVPICSLYMWSQGTNCAAHHLREPRPHHPDMAAHDFNRRQSIFMSFRVILSNTTSLSHFPCEDTRVQGSANAQRMPEMIAHLTWMNYLGQSCACAHHALIMRFNRK